MKSVGILTWYFGANYGAVAQSVALFNTLNDGGYDCKMINYRPANVLKTIIISNIPRKRERLKKFKETWHGLKKCYRLSQLPFLKETKKVSCAKDINDLNLDCIILGSDAIFNMKHPLCTSLYYGVGITTKKITYSPSCEYLEEDTKLPDDYCLSLKEMRAISVRDAKTRRLVENNIGYSPCITLDPTFLYDFHDFNCYVDQDNYILVYSFSTWDEYQKEIKEYAEQHEVNIISVGNYRKWADYSYPEASFELWISLFRKASVVVTDSFHGTVFALKNSKQIILCGRSDKQSKIISLLNQVEVSLQIYKGEKIDHYLENNKIDYSSTSQAIIEEVKKSYQYLMDSLEG